MMRRAVSFWRQACCWLALALPALAGAADARHEEGRGIYNYRCYFCHGYSGDARTLAATYLTPPPTDFTRAGPRLGVAEVVAVLEAGRPNTAMKSFAGVLGKGEIERVAEFVVKEFVERKAVNTRYHIPENGWPDHERYKIAYPFAKGEIPLSLPWESLTPEQAKGKRLYLSSCVSCHDRGAADAGDDVAWDARPLSYPRNAYSHRDPPVDATTSASPYAKHDVPKKIRGLTAREKRGERLFLDNCAFCHGADGTGKNWIGSFMEPHPRNLTDPAVMTSMSRKRLTAAIRDGLPNTSMPAWKSVLGDAEIRAIVDYVNSAFHPLRED